MKRILVHLHMYYHDQVDYFIEKMKNINGVDWDLVVTYSDFNGDSFEKLTKFKPDLKFRKEENFGYDIWPFIRLIKDTDLSTYDYVIKLHTKRPVPKCRPNIITFRNYDWRNALVDGLLFSEEHFRKVMKMFEEDPELGMVYSLLTKVKRDYFHPETKEELLRLGMDKKDKYVCMGSMFIMRSKALELLNNQLITPEIFKDETPISGTFFQKAHLYERILSHLPINSGLKQKTVCPKKSDLYKIKISKVFEPFAKFFFTCEREGRYRQKTVRIFRIKIYQDKTVAV